MHQAALMGVLQTQRGLARIFARLRRGKRAALLDQPAQILPFQILHGQKLHVGAEMSVVDLHDIRVG
jgi:hypothetical protein